MRMPRLAAAVAVTTLLVLAGTATATATWKASSGTTATATSATTSTTLAFAGATTLRTIYAATNTPNLASAMLVNTGTAPLNYALTASATPTNTTSFPTSSVGLAVWAETTCATPANWGTLAAPPALPAALASAAPGATLTLCLATRFTGSLATAAGQSVPVVLTVTGTAGTSTWTTSATLSFTQSVRVADVTGLKCTTSGYGLLNTNTQATLSWNAVVGTGVTYRVVYATGGATITPTATTATGATFRTENLSNTGGANAVLVQATDSFGSVSAGVPYTLTATSLLSLLIFTVAC